MADQIKVSTFTKDKESLPIYDKDFQDFVIKSLKDDIGLIQVSEKETKFERFKKIIFFDAKYGHMDMFNTLKLETIPKILNYLKNNSQHNEHFIHITLPETDSNIDIHFSQYSNEQLIYYTIKMKKFIGDVFRLEE